MVSQFIVSVGGLFLLPLQVHSEEGQGVSVSLGELADGLVHRCNAVVLITNF